MKEYGECENIIEQEVTDDCTKKLNYNWTCSIALRYANRLIACRRLSTNKLM